MTRYIVTRTITLDECHWLHKPVIEGTVVYAFAGQTYGVISPWGIACSKEYDKHPFFELPADAVLALEDE